MGIACNMITSHCSVKHTSYTTETALGGRLVGPSEVAGGRPKRPVEIQCETENLPPFSAKRRPAKGPLNLADRGRTLAETAELSTFPAYWSVRLATQFQTRAVREKVRVGLR